MTTNDEWEPTAVRYLDTATYYCLHVQLGHSSGTWTWSVTRSYATLFINDPNAPYATKEEAQAAAMRWLQQRKDGER